MNLNTLAHLIRPDVTTCEVRFSTGSQKAYTFKITHEMADVISHLQRDNHEEIDVLVQTCNGLRIAKVICVHDESRVDPEDDVDYQWVFQLVDKTALEEQEAVEFQIAEKLKNRRKLSQRQQALAALGITDPESFIQGLLPKE